jgi:hypothetical protein
MMNRRFFLFSASAAVGAALICYAGRRLKKDGELTNKSQSKGTDKTQAHYDPTLYQGPHLTIVFQAAPTNPPNGLGISLRAVQFNVPGTHYDQALNFVNVPACEKSVAAAELPIQIADQRTFGPCVVYFSQLGAMGFPPPGPDIQA